MAKTKNNPPTTIPTGSAQRVLTEKSHKFKKRSDYPNNGEMVMAALKALKDDDGVSLLTIYKYLFKNFGGFGSKIGKKRREEIREFIVAELKNGKIVTTNAGADAVNFEKSVIKMGTRFNIAE